MDKQALPQLDMLQRMIDLKVQNLKDLREKQQQDSKSDIITSEISDLEVNYIKEFTYIIYNVNICKNYVKNAQGNFPELKKNSSKRYKQRVYIIKFD